MARIDDVQEKWATNTKAKADIWAAEISKSETPGRYVKGVANFTGLSDSTVADSLPAKNFKTFTEKVASDPTTYKGLFTSGIDNAYEKNKWKNKYINAFKPAKKG